MDMCVCVCMCVYRDREKERGINESLSTPETYNIVNQL